MREALAVCTPPAPEPSALSLLHSPTLISIYDHLTRWTFVGKVMSLLLNMLSRLVITFLPRSKHLLSPRGSRCVGDFWGSQEGCQGPFRPSGRNRGLPLRRRRGQGPHLAKRWEPRCFSRVAAGFSSYDGDLSLPLGLALGSPIFPSGSEGKLGVALESLQGRRDLT